MRIHTDKTSAVWGAIYEAVRGLPGVYSDVSEYGSRSRKGALELRLRGNSGRHPNSGRWGADSGEYAATWDEWGIVLAAVFDADPEAICGTAKRPVYAGADDYHWQTGERFAAGTMPEDTHVNHLWNWRATGEQECRKCTAVRFAPLRG